MAAQHYREIWGVERWAIPGVRFQHDEVKIKV